MPNLTKSDELLEFIDKKVKVPYNIDNKQSFFLFTKVISNCLIDTYSKLNSISKSIACSEMIFSIFWLIYNYSHNQKLSMFLSERAIMLFIEYNLLSNNTIDLLDAKVFIYNKSIGPLKFLNKTCSIKNMLSISLLFKNVLYSVFTLSIKNDTQNILHIFCNQITNILYKLYINNELIFLQKNFTLDKTTTIDNLAKHINKLKLKLELYYYIINHSNNKQKNKRIFNKIKDNINVPNKYFTTSDDITNSIYFKEMLVQFKYISKSNSYLMDTI